MKPGFQRTRKLLSWFLSFQKCSITLSCLKFILKSSKDFGLTYCLSLKAVEKKIAGVWIWLIAVFTSWN
jgi:hypothetical protein